MTDPSEWLSLGEAAAVLGVHPTTLRQWADHGELPSQRTPGGHRRFQRATLEGFLSARSTSEEAQTSEVEVMIRTALGNARLQIGSGQLDGLPWYDRMDEDARQTLRVLGRRLLDLLTRYLADAENKALVLREAQVLGIEYARSAAGQGLTLADTVQAFLFFRDLLVESVIQLAEVLSLRTPRDWGQRLHQVNHLVDELLLAMIEEFQSGEQVAARP